MTEFWETERKMSRKTIEQWEGNTATNEVGWKMIWSDFLRAEGLVISYLKSKTTGLLTGAWGPEGSVGGIY